MRAHRTALPNARQRLVPLPLAVLKRMVVQHSVLQRSLLQRMGALFIALLLAFGPQLSALHFTLIAHEVCHEHGELHHAEAVHGGHASDPAAREHAASEHPSRELPASAQHSAAQHSAAQGAAPSPAPKDPVASSSGAAEAHEHEHCGAASNSVQSATLDVPATKLASVLPAADSPAPDRADERAHSSIPLLAYAPKLAPPARPLA